MPPQTRATPPRIVSPSATRGDAAYFRQVAEWGIQAAEALEHAHSMGVVHRDVKPGNLLLDRSGQVWVADFGLAKLASSNAGVTVTGDVLGTLRYMMPEQAGAKHGLVDASGRRVRSRGDPLRIADRGPGRGRQGQGGDLAENRVRQSRSRRGSSNGAFRPTWRRWSSSAWPRTRPNATRRPVSWPLICGGS